jgi:hypothetical protein
MNAQQAQRNALSQKIENALLESPPSSVVIHEACHVASILWRSSGDSEYGYRQAELIGMPQRIRSLAAVLDISIEDAEIEGCGLT